MKKIIAISILLILNLMLNSFINFENSEPVFQYKEYLLGPNSTLEINGKTNINSFCCSSKEGFPKGSVSYQLENETATFYFKNTDLKINIQQLDCAVRSINRDLRKTLQADEYPTITIALKQASNLDCSNTLDCDRWIEFEAIADITLTCVTKTFSIPIYIKKKNENQFQITGTTTLFFKEFGLVPPSALMGLIKVKESIDIKFDLYVILL